MGEYALGQGIARSEDPRLLKGLGRYIDDIVLPRMVHGFVLRSPHAHAVIRSIDTTAALESPGVLAVLTGELAGPVTVNQPLGDDLASPVSIKTAVRADGKAAVSHFLPLAAAGGFTLVRVNLETGRKHQIRAHAQWLGHFVVGDKLYGPDPNLYLDFVHGGWTPALAARLLIPRQALHCQKIDFLMPDWPQSYTAPLPADLRDFCAKVGLAL